MLVEFMLFCTKPELVHVSGQWFLVIFVAVGSSIRRVQVSCKMVLRQPAYRQQVGTLYEMTSPSSLWNASPQTTRVQRHAARHRATTQSFRLSTNARASRGFSRKCGDTTGSRKGETQREKISGENDAKWKMSLLWFVNKKSCFCTIVKC